MKIRISLPENRDHAGHLEVLDGDGAIVFGPVPAAGRAHDELAAAHGNASRSPLRAYGDTPLGTYAVRGVVAADAPEEGLGTRGVVLLEPVSGQAALADAHGRFRLFIQGGGDDDGGLRATAGAVRIHDRDQEQLIALVRRTPGRVLCEVVTTVEQGAKVSLAGPPPDRDPPALPGRSYVSIQPSAESLSRSLASSSGARAAGYKPRMFVVPERSGSSASTAYGGGGGSGDEGGGADIGTGPTDTGVGPLPITGVDVAPTPGADLNPPPDETGVTVAQSGGSQLLSTAAPTGLPSPYSLEELGWIVGQEPNNPFTGTPAAGGPLAPFTGNDVDAYSGAPPGAANPNAYTGSLSVDPSSGSTNADFFGGNPHDTSQWQAFNGPGFVGSPDAVTPTAPIAPSGAPDSPSMDGSRVVNETDLSDANGQSLLYGQQPINIVPIGGTDYGHYQVNLGGITYDVYVNDTALPDKAILVPAASQTATASLAGAPNPTVTTSTTNVTPTTLVPSDPTILPPTPPWETPPWAPPSNPVPRAASAIPGGLGVGSTSIPEPNWFWRGLSETDPKIAGIEAGADLVPHEINQGRTYVQGTPPEMTFRQTRPGGPPNAQGLRTGSKFTLGTDRISTAKNLETFLDGGRLANRGTGELVRIDVDLARSLGAEFLEPGDLLDHLDTVEAGLRQRLADLTQQAANGRVSNRLQDKIDKVDYDLVSVDKARAHVNEFVEGEGVGSIPSRAISRVPGASLPEAAAGEARFLQNLDAARGLGEGFLVVGAATSVERILTAPPGQGGRVGFQEAGGWAFSFLAASAGASAGAALGAFFGIETGPGAILTGAIGALFGGAFGFFTGQVIGDEAYTGFESGINYLFNSMIQGQIEQDAEAARRGSTTGELPPPYLNNGPSGDPLEDAFLFP